MCTHIHPNNSHQTQTTQINPDREKQLANLKLQQEQLEETP